MTQVGFIFPPNQPPERLRQIALAVEDSALDDLWLWEDCFAESGITPAAVVLEATKRIKVGIGLLPVPLRNVALTAMEIATMERLHPGRFLPGIGHGVLSWMGQVGARVSSPLTLLREQGTALRDLLAGQEVTVSGRYVSLDKVQLAWPPAAVPPIYVGAVKAKTMALAAQIGDGIIFTGQSTPQSVRDDLLIANEARSSAGISTALDNVVFLSLPLSTQAAEVADRIGQLSDAGATRVAVVAIGTEGGPDSTAGSVDFVEVVASARTQLDQ